MTLVTIVNYGVGNLYSAKKGLEKAGATVEILNDPAEVRSSDAIVLPGVGAIAEAKKNLSELEDVLIQEVKNGKPVLGICLGLQLLFTKSHEGGVTAGLNLLRGEVIKLPTTVKLPQIGWNNIEIARSSPLLEEVPNNSYAYFVHSYVARPRDEGDVSATTEYGSRFPSVFDKGNIFATQFHPEKSAQAGLMILRNFVRTIRK